MASLIKEPNGRKTIQVNELSEPFNRPKVRLGKCSLRVAEKAKGNIEELVTCSQKGLQHSPELRLWLESLSDELHDRLAVLGLLEQRAKSALAAFLNRYLESRSDVKPETLRAWRQVADRLTDAFGADCSLNSVSAEMAAEWRQSLVNEKLADATVRKYTGYAKHFFAVAVRRKLLSENPFVDLVSGSVGNDERQTEVTQEETKRLIDACPDAELRLIVALSRYGGLRCPSEHRLLRWSDIDWANDLMTVRSPKTQKQGKQSRLVPIFDELRGYLLDAAELNDNGSEFVLQKYRSPNGAYVRKRLEKIRERAGLRAWPRITHNLRASRQTELARENPMHIVCAILGNTPKVAHRHYIQVSQADILKAAGKAVQNAVQYSPDSARMEPQSAGSEQRPERAQLSTAQPVTARCESLRGSGQNRSAGVDGNRTHLASFQRPHRV
jgi:integrase